MKCHPDYRISGIGHSLCQKKEPGGLRRFDIKIAGTVKQEKADSGYHGDIHPPNRRLKAWYQPVFNLKTNRFSSAEAPSASQDYDG